MKPGNEASSKLLDDPWANIRIWDWLVTTITTRDCTLELSFFWWPLLQESTADEPKINAKTDKLYQHNQTLFLSFDPLITRGASV